MALSPDITMSIKRMFASAITPAIDQSSIKEWRKSERNCIEMVSQLTERYLKKYETRNFPIVPCVWRITIYQYDN